LSTTIHNNHKQPLFFPIHIVPLFVDYGLRNIRELAIQLSAIMGLLLLGPLHGCLGTLVVPDTSKEKSLIYPDAAPPKAKGQKMALGEFLQDSCTQCNEL
jgi:hypothetical protein